MKYKLIINRIYVLFLVILMVFSISACSNIVQNEKITFGVIPADDVEEMLNIYRPIANYLTEVLGVEVELIALTDYTAAIEAMRTGRIEIAWFGPFSYVLAAERAGAEAIVIGVREDTGLSSYRTIFVTHSDNAYTNFVDLQNKSFAFVDPASTSGHLVPRSILIDSGIDPEEHFSNILFAGTHNSVLFAVRNKTVSAGATSDNVLKRMIDEGLVQSNEISIIHQSDPIPGSPIAVRGNLDDDFKLLIQSAFINMPSDIAAGWGGIAYYEIISDVDYDVIRNIAKQIDIFD